MCTNLVYDRLKRPSLRSSARKLNKNFINVITWYNKIEERQPKIQYTLYFGLKLSFWPKLKRFSRALIQNAHSESHLHFRYNTTPVEVEFVCICAYLSNQSCFGYPEYKLKIR